MLATPLAALPLVHYTWSPGLMIFMICRSKHFALERFFPDHMFYRTNPGRMSSWFYRKALANGVMDFLIFFLFAGWWRSLIFGVVNIIIQCNYARLERLRFEAFQMCDQLGADTVRLARAYELRSYVQSMYYGIVVLVMLKYMFLGSQAAEMLKH